MKIIIVSLLAVAMIGLMVPNVFGESGSLSTYVHPEGKFSLQYPSTWIVEDYMDEPLGGVLYIYDDVNWTIQVEVWDLGPIPFIDTQSEMDRYHGTMGGELLTCTIVSILVEGYTCKDFELNEFHDFITLPSGEQIWTGSYTSIRQYDPETTTGEEVLILTDVFDFMCCTNHIYSMLIHTNLSNPANYDSEEHQHLMELKKDIVKSFSFSTTPYTPQKSTQPSYSYEPTHVSNFPDPTKSPEHYLDRYNNEDAYREWFDSQFPDRTIHEILGMPEPVQPELEPEPVANKIPEWVKNIFAWYAQDQISEDEVLNAIKFLVNQGIINLDE